MADNQSDITLTDAQRIAQLQSFDQSAATMRDMAQVYAGMFGAFHAELKRQHVPTALAAELTLQYAEAWWEHLWPETGCCQ